MSTQDIAIWGAIGAAGSLMVIYAIPGGIAIYKGNHPTPSGARFGGALIVLGATLFLGALTAILVGATDMKTAAGAGIAYQSTLAGFVKANGG